MNVASLCFLTYHTLLLNGDIQLQIYLREKIIRKNTHVIFYTNFKTEYFNLNNEPHDSLDREVDYSS